MYTCAFMTCSTSCYLYYTLINIFGWSACWLMLQNGPQESVPSLKLRTCINMVMKSKVFWMCYLILSLKHERTDFCDVGSTRRRKLYVTICTLFSFSLFVHEISHTCNTGHVNFSLQSICYKIQLILYGHSTNVI